jgi:hypothetical protein
MDLLSIVFHDLAVPASTRLTEAPKDAPRRALPVRKA